ncbi:Rsd/AlgQ family anti-sigma factor [Pragia fontium]|uniref:Regulator of sigma D n=2 Tax=Pragia fontium TaxID=82985 RepID=A0AAJ4WDS4_9GAMM|nr:Rsd/AlgQ family anti-sigma factor [Pragia fontium]AKJ43351.1 regulator of sigma D [Pragia fontium]SFD48605.1 regulator of sigma D [Pragia fontium DSM 5563 = ATCC 49100]SUB83823.1 Regulator of sigma D [Pragia fontium]VEJ56727.1 Regulator of sigma D [Pragia fontium]GKX64676.1 regulator of sigma D [Pragia fontium]
MLNRLESLAERVGGTNKLIDQWLESRKNLLVTYYRLVGIKPNKEKNIPLDEKALIDFGHHLVDYLSSCHFHIYDKIIIQEEGAKSPNLAIAARIHPRLEENTENIMAFYDSYVEKGINEDTILQLDKDLSTVGELLEKRFTLEDKLIQEATSRWLSHHASDEAAK